MANIVLANQTVPSTPSSGNTTLYTETTTKKLHSLADDGVARLVQPLSNTNTAQQSIVTSDTYITGSNLSIPPSLLRAGATFVWRFGITRSGAGTATPVYTVRFGTAGTTSDTARLTFTSARAQTNAADSGFHEIVAVCRVASSTVGVLAGIMHLQHNLQTTGLAAQQTEVLSVVSGSFDTTVASSIIGVSVNPGATSTWLFETVSVLGFNL